MSPTSGAAIGTLLSISVGEMSIWMNLRSVAFGAAPGLALAVREQPVEARADQHHDVGLGEHVRARRRRRLRVGVGQEALGHRHRQVGDAGLLDQGADLGVGARVRRAFAEDDERPLGALQHVERALDRVGRRDLARRRIDDLDERALAGRGVHRLREELGREIEVDAAGTARHCRADRARDADADVFGVEHAKRRLAQRLGDRELVHLLVVALLQVDDLALARAADQDHREAVGRRVGERRQAVQESGRGDGQADAGLAGEKARRRGGVAGMLLVAKRDDAQAFCLHLAREVGDRDARQAEDRVDAVQLQRIDDEVESVRSSPRGLRLPSARRPARLFAHGLRDTGSPSWHGRADGDALARRVRT